MDSRMKHVLGAVSASALLVLVVFLGWSMGLPAIPGNGGSPGSVSPDAGPYGNFTQFVMVLMENHDLADIYGPAPYMTGLADQYTLSQHWASITNPSQPNYIALIGGSTFGVVGDGNHPNLNQPTIVDLFVNSGKTWKAIAEGASGTGAGLNPPRGEDHFPFLSYTTIKGNSTRAANMIPGDSSTVLSELNAGTNFIWFTPTDQHNMHDNSVASGDAWLQSWVPGLLTAMAGKRAVLFIVYDEGYRSPPLVYAGFSGTATKLAYKSTVPYTHYSFIKLLEDVWGGGTLGQGDVGAASPLEFFTANGPPPPDFALAASPASVSFVAGQSATSTISLTNSGGFSGTVSLTTASVPPGATASCVPTSISGSQTSLCTISSTTPGAYAITVTGTSGSLVHVAPIAVVVTRTGPTARFTYSPAVAQVNDTISFDASSSSDSNASATLQARWDWEADGVWDTPFSSTLTATHVYGTAGTYAARLQIQDSASLTDTTTHTVVILGSTPGGVGAPPGYGPTDPSKFQAHGPIYIGSNAAFTAANGVRSGNGTAIDPFIVRDWFFEGNLYPTAPAMIWIESTDMYVVIENVRIVNLTTTNQWEGIQLGHWPATITTKHVTIRHTAVENAQHAYGIAVREGSSDVRVEANYVRLNANYDWVYGIATDRGVHNVTVFGNYVNAYTSGTFHTAGLHLSDFYVNDARDATGVVATRNTVVNATAGAIVSESSYGTVVGGNLVYMDYPGTKSIAADYPRGIMTEWNSNQTLVVGNVIHTFHWGIQIGSDHGVFHSNTIYDVDYAVYILDANAWPGISSTGDTVYDTTYWNVATMAFRFPSNFQGTVVDVGPGTRTSDFTPVTLRTLGSPTLVGYVWTGNQLNLSVTLGGAVLYDAANTTESQTLQASWTGTIASLGVTNFAPGRVSFALQSSVLVAFDGTGFTPSTTYNLTRSDSGGTTKVLSAMSSPTGALSCAIPSAGPSSYALAPGSSTDTTPPTTTLAASGSAGANSWYTSSVSVTLSAIDDSSGVQSIHFRVDGGAWQTYGSPFVVPGDGYHSVDYYATDNLGNTEGAHSASVNIDGTAPSTSAQLTGSVAGDGSYIASVTIALTANDATSGVQSIRYRIDGGAWRTYTNTYPLSGNGTHTLDYAATDNAGNVEATKTSTVRISASLHSPPVTTMQAAGTDGTNGWYTSEVNVSLSATSPSGTPTTIAYSIDGGAWALFSQAFAVGEGRHTLQYQSSDAAGYVEVTRSSSIDVDLTPPSVTWTSPSGQVTTSDVTISWSGSDATSGIVGYAVSIDGGAFVSVGMTTSLTQTWTAGDHTVIVQAFDAAGNSHSTPDTFNVSPGWIDFLGPLQRMPLIAPALCMVLFLLAAVLLVRRRRRGVETERAEAEEEPEAEAEYQPEFEDPLEI